MILSLLSQSCLILSTEILTLRQLYEVILNVSAVNGSEGKCGGAMQSSARGYTHWPHRRLQKLFPTAVITVHPK